jgi:ABC-2 type transport system ATP-binding protein
MTEPMIQVKNVSKDFLLPHLRQTTLKSRVLNLFRQSRTIEVQHALRDISFDVKRGEFLGVVGRNGSGKSTLLKILAGIYVPTSGSVVVGGKLVPFIELGVGFSPELTGRENVYLNGALLGFSKGEVQAMYGDIVAFAELEESMDQKLKNYSSGMQVRIAFSVATRAKADILIVDEVLAVGDAAFQRKCFEHFRALKKSDTTIVFVTHDMGAVRQFCDRAILIEDGGIAAQGSAEEVSKQYMELFSPTPSQPGSSGVVQDKVKRRGSGDIRYTEVTVPALLGEEGSLSLKLEATAEQDVDEPAYGFLIKNSSGSPVLGTNSTLKRQFPGSVHKGERVRIAWSVPNVFSDGLHHVDLKITDRQGLAIYDWWEEAATFTVVKKEKTPYIVTPDTSLVIAKTGAADA